MTTSRTLIGFALLLPLSGLVSACGDSADLVVFPPRVHAGFDGTNSYKAPIVASDGTGRWDGAQVTWTIQDPSVADLMVGAGGVEVMIVVKKPGSTSVTATSDGQTATRNITVFNYTLEQYEAGKQRYLNMHEGEPPCAMCHSTGPDHSPTVTAADNDSEVIGSYVNGVDPEGVQIDADNMHIWKVTPDQKVGLVAYLRSLEPRGYPDPSAP